LIHRGGVDVHRAAVAFVEKPIEQARFPDAKTGEDQQAADEGQR
jgi:hypothetical protein